jgi:probable HAF family extracellular repeat protein
MNHATTPLLLLLAGAVSAGAANVTYYVNLTIGLGSVTGSIVTDGTIGVLAQSDLISWNLALSNGAAAFNLSGSNFFEFVGSDLSATGTQLLFNFGGTDGGNVEFSNLAFSDAVCFTANTVCSAAQLAGSLKGASSGETFFVGGYPNINPQSKSLSGTQVIAAVALARPITYTLSGNLTGTIGATPLANAPFVWTEVADTTGVTLVESQRYQNAATTSDINITGAGDATATDSVMAYIDQRNQSGSGLAGLSNLAGSFAIALINPTAVDLWLLATSIGPISGSAEDINSSSLNTSLGQLTITSVSNLTFQASAPLSAPGPYTFSSISVPGSTLTSPAGISNNGQVVGDYISASGVYHGFLLSGGGYTTIDPPGSTFTQPNGINDAGQVVGEYEIGGVSYAFVLSDSTYTTLDVPGSTSTSAYGINDSGQVVGYYVSARETHGFLLSGGAYTNIDFPGATLTEALGINNSGQVVGEYESGGLYYAFLMSDGDYTTLPIPGSEVTLADGINDSGQVVGVYETGGNTLNSFLLNGANYTTIPGPGSAGTVIGPINDSGQFTGTYASGGTTYAFVATPSPFFVGSVNGGAGTQYLQFPNGNVFGYYGFLGGYWMYHADLGYEYVSPGNGAEVYLWDLTSGHWWYTDTSTFPNLYDFTLNTWIYYFPNTQSPGRYTSNPRYFTNLTTGQIFTM